ncbi:MAG TPA: orotidine-5'-phosphate decarboxylase [Candidatus Limnocylindrales bacterium]|nr:orotidine-5'-phosphate decarboxylase [Candidatus Limnocylindrales bacterium]
MTLPGTYLERLAARSAAVGSVLCLGIDPDPSTLPDGFSRDVRGIERFALLLVEAAAEYAAAVKPNLAFFEAFGAAGWSALERVRAAIPEGIPVIADAKRADIDSTTARQVVGYYDSLGVDAVTISPYLGEEAIAAYIDRADRFAYVLCRTSNSGAAELQALAVRAHWADDGALIAPDEPLWARVARRVATWGPGGTAGLVVGATAPNELRVARTIAPGLAILVPGVGSQGGAIEPVLASGPATAAPAGGRPGGGLVVNVSRGIASAAAAAGGDDGDAGGGVDGDPAERIREAARSWSEKLPVLP